MLPCQEPLSFGSYVGRVYFIKRENRAAIRRYLRRLTLSVHPQHLTSSPQECAGRSPAPLQAREKHNICGSKNRAVRRGGLLPHSRRRRRAATKVQTPSRHSSLESAYLAPRQGIDIIPQFVAVGSAAITVIGRQYMPLAKGTKIILAARLQKQSALRAFIVLAPHGIARRAADIAAVEQVQFSRLKECSRDMRKQDE